MDNIKDLLEKYKSISVEEKKIKDWQENALEAVNFFVDGKKNIGSIFRCFKINNHLAKISYLDCKELEKNSSLYFFKVFNELKNKVL